MEAPISALLTLYRGPELQLFPGQHMFWEPKPNTGTNFEQAEGPFLGWQSFPWVPHLLKKICFLTPPAVIHVSKLLAQLGVPDGHPVFVIFELQSAQETLLVQV